MTEASSRQPAESVRQEEAALPLTGVIRGG